MDRYIFDIDGTLLNLDCSFEDRFFEDVLVKGKGIEFNKMKYGLNAFLVNSDNPIVKVKEIGDGLYGYGKN